jgi:hypothetical protein
MLHINTISCLLILMGLEIHLRLHSELNKLQEEAVTEGCCKLIHNNKRRKWHHRLWNISGNNKHRLKYLKEYNRLIINNSSILVFQCLEVKISLTTFLILMMKKKNQWVKFKKLLKWVNNKKVPNHWVIKDKRT